jgi:hypothetical protein
MRTEEDGLKCHITKRCCRTILPLRSKIAAERAVSQDTKGLTHRELDHEPCLAAIP